MERTLNIAPVADFVRAKTRMTFDLSELPDHILAELVHHGLAQKVGDAAAGKDGDEARAAMDGVWGALKAGEWRKARAAGSGRTELEQMMVKLARNAAKPGIGGYKDMTPAERDEAVWAFVEAMTEAGRATLEKAATRQLEFDREQAAMVAALKVDITV